MIQCPIRRAKFIRKQVVIRPKIDKYLAGVKSNIRDLRRKKNMTQVQLAEMSGLHQVSIARYETGDNTPTLEAIYRIADAFKMKPKEILDI
jgi:transcriptional regulator with XRE-family HTH domain